MHMYVVVSRIYGVRIRTHSHTYAPSYSYPTTNVFAYSRIIVIENVQRRTYDVVVVHQSYMPYNFVVERTYLTNVENTNFVAKSWL